MSSRSCTSVSPCQCFAHSFLLFPHLFMDLACLSPSLPPSCWFRHGLAHRPTDKLLAFFLLSSYPIFFSQKRVHLILQQVAPSSHCVLPLEGEATFFVIGSQQSTDPPTLVRVHFALCLSFPHHVCSSSVPPAFILVFRCKAVFTEPWENYRPTVFTPFSS